MGKFIDLTGKKFGRLTVIHRAPNKKKQIEYFCMCDCKSSKIINGYSLSSNKTKSCGCICSEKAREIRKAFNATKFNKDTPLNYAYRSKKSLAKRRGLEFTIDFEKFKETVFSNCVYTNLPPSGKRVYSRSGNRYSPHNGSILNLNSIDRIDPKYGYHDWNVQSCNKNINTAKNDLSPEEWDNLIERMSEVFYTKNPGKLLALVQKLGLAQVA
jgi:hypothetical protein